MWTRTYLDVMKEESMDPGGPELGGKDMPRNWYGFSEFLLKTQGKMYFNVHMIRLEADAISL